MECVIALIVRLTLPSRWLLAQSLTTETLEQGVKYVQRYQNDVSGVVRRSGALIINFEHILHLVLVILLLTLNTYLPAGL